VLALTCLAAFAIRIAYCVHAGDGNFWENGYIFFYDIAKNIVAGKGLLSKASGLGARPPVYPYFLALTNLAGENYLLVVSPEALFGFGTVFCAYLIGNELFGRRTGMIAALVTAFYPYYLVHDTALQETMFI
jgi:4-amino-4-deoxy-L-arabinose transferase-like glycosyltransferase